MNMRYENNVVKICQKNVAIFNLPHSLSLTRHCLCLAGTTQDKSMGQVGVDKVPGVGKIWAVNY